MVLFMATLGRNQIGAFFKVKDHSLRRSSEAQRLQEMKLKLDARYLVYGSVGSGVDNHAPSHISVTVYSNKPALCKGTGTVRVLRE